MGPPGFESGPTDYEEPTAVSAEIGRAGEIGRFAGENGTTWPSGEGPDFGSFPALTGHMLVTRRCDGVEDGRRLDVLVEKVYVHVQRERRLVVAEPALHLHGVPAVAEEERRARVPEGVKADPSADAGLPRSRLQDAADQVRLVDAGAVLGSEDELFVACGAA